MLIGTNILFSLSDMYSVLSPTTSPWDCNQQPEIGGVNLALATSVSVSSVVMAGLLHSGVVGFPADGTGFTVTVGLLDFLQNLAGVTQ